MRQTMTETLHEFIKSAVSGRVGTITLQRPRALNALNGRMVAELSEVLEALERNPDIGCILLKGQDAFFCAGADIKEATDASYPDTLIDDFLAGWDRIARVRKPLVAAVAGPAFGGGCEITMMCDVIVAAESARFSLPEIRLGTMPGAGGTQRLALALGKAKALDLCLTGRPMLAEEAERSGLVSRVVPDADLEAEAMAVATTIAAASLPAALSIKEAVLAAFDGLGQGLRLERRLFQALFATEDQREGMLAFTEKRAARFRHR
ncbi:enoyl-CoA hydratase-related protein [Pseudochelatococcus sp. B33]